MFTIPEFLWKANWFLVFFVMELNYSVENLEKVQRIILSRGLNNVGKLEKPGEERV